jgi:hypothetical protein
MTQISTLSTLCLPSERYQSTAFHLHSDYYKDVPKGINININVISTKVAKLTIHGEKSNKEKRKVRHERLSWLVYTRKEKRKERKNVVNVVTMIIISPPVGQ